MKIEINSTNFSLNQEQLDFVKEKSAKIRELSKTLNDESHVIHINFKHTESKAKDDNITCTITATVKGHKDIRVEKTTGSVESAIMDAKKAALSEIKKIKDQIHPNGIHS